MWNLALLATLQCLLLAVGQVFLKFAMRSVGEAHFSWAFLKSLLCTWWFHAHLGVFASAAVLWWYIMKKYPLSMAYPLTSFSYVVGLAAAMLIFHEQITLHRWVGAVLIVAGCCLIAK